MHLKKADHVIIYNIEHRNGETCFVGTIHECMKYLNIDNPTIIYSHMSRFPAGGYLKKLYKVTFSHYEPIEEKVCRRCGKLKPINQFPLVRRKGKPSLHPNFCKVCFREKDIEYRRRVKRYE